MCIIYAYYTHSIRILYAYYNKHIIRILYAWYTHLCVSPSQPKFQIDARSRRCNNKGSNLPLCISGAMATFAMVPQTKALPPPSPQKSTLTKSLAESPTIQPSPG